MTNPVRRKYFALIEQPTAKPVGRISDCNASRSAPRGASNSSIGDVWVSENFTLCAAPAPQPADARPPRRDLNAVVC